MAKKDERRTMIVTFKPKEKRPDKAKDKQQVLLEATRSEVSFFTAADFSRGVPVPSAMPTEQIGYDVNEYEAPILMANLTDKEIEALKKNGNVKAVEEDGEVHAADFETYPGWPVGQLDARLRAPVGLWVEGQPVAQAETIPSGISQIRAPAAWDCSRGKAIKVAVLDTGIDFTHPDLEANYRFGTSFVPTESSAMDHNGHGTHCAGIIAAALNGSGVVGVAPAAYLYAVKVLSKTGAGQWSWLIAGIDWCVNKKGLKILSMSLSGSSAPAALEAMCNAAWNKGAVMVAAAGNSGGPVNFPAKYKSVIAVSAIDSGNLIAGFSSRGPEVELCAPGVQVLSTVPGGGYQKMSGTSMACPHVAGAAALTWGSHRYADNVSIRRLLSWRSDNLGNPGRDNLYGFGRVDAEQSACELTPPPPIPGLP